MWKVKEHKIKRTYIELQVVSLVKEIAASDHVTWAGSFEDNFDARIKEIKSTNAVLPQHSYRITMRNESSVEFSKMSSNGDFNYKILTLDYIK